MRGFELTVTSCDQEGNLTAVYEFYDLYGENKVYGSYNIEGKITTELSDGSVIASTKGCLLYTSSSEKRGYGQRRD